MCDFLSAYSSLCAESASDSLAGSSFRRLIRMYRPCYRLIVSPPTSGVMRLPHPIQSEVRRGCPEKKKDEVCAHAGVAKFADRASKMSTAFSFAAGLGAFRRRPECAQDRVTAIGYCVGGCGALELARAGTALRAVVSVHGILSAPIRAKRNTVMSEILVLHGDADPLVAFDEVAAFREEMGSAEAPGKP